MRLLTRDEINFVKATKFTPTVFQCDQYYLTIFESYEQAKEFAKRVYNFDLGEFLEKNIGVELNDSDSISLEMNAAYLFYCFFTKEELDKMSAEEGLAWLQDYRYFLGYRKWSPQDARNAMDEAISIHYGYSKVTVGSDNNVWIEEII